MSQSKKITLGICGGIAAYKSCELIRLLVKENYQVTAMMTQAAQKFVTPLTFQTLTNRPVVTGMFHIEGSSTIEHIQLANNADLVIIAPATANIIAKAAHGICDDIVSTVLCATKAPVIIAPGMNSNMYDNPITRQNIARLTECNYHLVGPEEGPLACGYEGQGRMTEPATLFEETKKILKE